MAHVVCPRSCACRSAARRTVTHERCEVLPMLTPVLYHVDMGTLIEAKGMTGTVTFDGVRVVQAHKSAGTKIVPIGQVSHTVYSRPTFWVSNGLWGMAVEGQVLEPRNIRGVRAALDGNYIVMRLSQRAAFDELDAAIREAIGA